MVPMFSMPSSLAMLLRFGIDIACSWLMLIKESPRFRAFFSVCRSSSFPLRSDSLVNGAFGAGNPAPLLLVEAGFLVSFGDFLGR